MSQQADGSADSGRWGCSGVLWRVLAYLTIALSIIGVLICLALTAGIWINKEPLKERVAAGVERLDMGLGLAQDKLHRINAGLGTLNDANLDPTLTTLSATVIGVNGALRALDTIPYVDVPTLDDDQLQALSARVQTALATAAGARESAEAKTTDLERQVAAAREQVRAFGVAGATWIDRGAIALTLLFLWLALAQACLLRSALSYLRSGA